VKLLFFGFSFGFDVKINFGIEDNFFFEEWYLDVEGE
jgi:hypothetical protein